MNGNDAICKPLLSLYNTLLGEAIAAIKLHPTTATITSDFEVLYPDKFQAVGFRSPPLVEGDALHGVYLADVFNNGEPRYVMSYDQIGPPLVGYGNYDTGIQILKMGVARSRWNWKETGIFESAHVDLLGWVSSADKKYGVTYGYVLNKWPGIGKVLKRKPDIGSYTRLETQPIIFPPISIRMFIHDATTIFIADEYNDISAFGVRSLVVVYTATHDEPTDVCYLQLGWTK